MRKVVESHKKAFKLALCIMFALFIAKVGFEEVEQKGLHTEIYTGSRLNE